MNPLSSTAPHYYLHLHTSRAGESGHWRFTICSPDGQTHFEAADVEDALRGDRLDLLTVVRGLEALDEPSRVTLVGCSQYVRQGIQFGLHEWRDNGWRWEWFGQLVPVKNADLWQRLDQALRFHEVDWQQQRRVDGPHAEVRQPKTAEMAEKASGEIRPAEANWVRYASLLAPSDWSQRLAALASSARRWLTEKCYEPTRQPAGIRLQSIDYASTT